MPERARTAPERAEKQHRPCCGRPRRGTCWLELGTPELAAPAGVETATNCLEGITALLDSVALAVSFAEVRRELVEDLNEEPLEGDEEL